MIRKGQACGSAMGTGSGLLHRFVLGMFGIGGLIHLVIAPTFRSILKLQHFPLELLVSIFLGFWFVPFC